MTMDANDLATLQHMENVYRPSCTLSQLEMNAVGVLLEFTPNQPQEYAVLQWSRKRKRSYRLGSFDYKEGEKLRRARPSAFREGEHFVPFKPTLIDAEEETFSKDVNARAKSPNSPLPSLQIQCRTSGLKALSASQKSLCKQLLKVAVRLGWEIKSMRNKKSLLMEELDSLKNQNFCLKQQHSSTKAIQPTEASKSQVPGSPSPAEVRYTMPQDHRMIKEGDERGGSLTDSTSGRSTTHNLNAFKPITPPSIDHLSSQSSKECTPKAPDCTSRTSPQKNMNILNAHAEANVEEDPSPTSGDAQAQSTGTTVCQMGTHAALLYSNEHGFIDAHGTWVIAPESAENYIDGGHTQLTCTHEDLNHCADDVQAQTMSPHPYVEDIPAQQLTAPPHYMNQCVDGVLARPTASLNHFVVGTPLHPKSPPLSQSRCGDGISISHAHHLQCMNPCVDNEPVQLPCPLQILNNGALAQLPWPSSTYARSPQAIVLLYDRKFAFAEARRRRKEMNRIKRHQSRASRLH